MYPLKLSIRSSSIERVAAAKYINCFLLVRKEQEEGGRREDTS